MIDKTQLTELQLTGDKKQIQSRTTGSSWPVASIAFRARKTSHYKNPTCSFSIARAAMLEFLKLTKAQKRSWRTRMLSISPKLVGGQKYRNVKQHIYVNYSETGDSSEILTLRFEKAQKVLLADICGDISHPQWYAWGPVCIVRWTNRWQTSFVRALLCDIIIQLFHSPKAQLTGACWKLIILTLTGSAQNWDPLLRKEKLTRWALLVVQYLISQSNKAGYWS